MMYGCPDGIPSQVRTKKMGGESNSPPIQIANECYFFFFAAFFAGAFFTAFLTGFLAASFFAGAFFAFLVAIDNPPFRSAVAVDEKFFDQH